MEKNYKLLDHTILSYFLLAIFVAVFEELIGQVIDKPLAEIIPGYAFETMNMGTATENAVGVGTAAAALLAAGLFKLRFRPDFNGCLQKAGLKEGLLMLLPFLVFHGVFIALLRATAPGFGEEIMFRGLGIANYMRKIETEGQIKVIFWISSITFGLIHLTNLFAGGDLMSVLLQAPYAIGVGMLFGAVYLRTGNLWPTILGHWSVDFFEFVRADLYGSGGIMTGMGVGDWITIAAGVFAAFWGLRLMDPKYYGEIMEIWAAKWNRKTEEGPAAD